MRPRQQLIVLGAILAVAAAVDFIQRIYVPRAATSRDAEIEMTSLPELPLSLALARERLQSWFPTQTSGQQGLLGDGQVQPDDSTVLIPDRADIGGWRFVLRGIFDAGPPFAVFDVMSKSGGAVEQHRLSAGEAIKGVRVEQIAGQRVSLSDGEKVIQLVLFIEPGNNLASADEPDE